MRSRQAHENDTHGSYADDRKYEHLVLRDSGNRVETVLSNWLNPKYHDLKRNYQSEISDNFIVGVGGLNGERSRHSSRGKSIPGEAELSLARSYFQAGSQAVVASLWPVNDKSTAQIMVEFYRHLKRGKRKDEALRLAKEHYVSQAAPRGRHPYYWAGFVAIGDMSPLRFKNNNSSRLLWIGLLGLALLFGGAVRIIRR